LIVTINGFFPTFGDIPFWSILASRVVIPYIFISMRDNSDAVGTRTLRCPRDSINGRRSRLSSQHQPLPSLPACYLMPRSCASRHVLSMTPRHRSPYACSQPRSARPVRSAPLQRGASIVTTGAPWQTCPGRSIEWTSSYSRTCKVRGRTGDQVNRVIGHF
jgi:hypothetical protein